MLTLEKSYIRISPDGIKSHITINNQKDLEYYRDLESHGFTYKPLLVIHRNLQECESCSA